MCPVSGKNYQGHYLPNFTKEWGIGSNTEASPSGLGSWAILKPGTAACARTLHIKLASYKHSVTIKYNMFSSLWWRFELRAVHVSSMSSHRYYGPSLVSPSLNYELRIQYQHQRDNDRWTDDIFYLACLHLYEHANLTQPHFRCWHRRKIGK